MTLKAVCFLMHLEHQLDHQGERRKEKAQDQPLTLVYQVQYYKGEGVLEAASEVTGVSDLPEEVPDLQLEDLLATILLDQLLLCLTILSEEVVRVN